MWGWPVKNRIARAFAVLSSILLIVPPEVMSVRLSMLIAAGLLCAGLMVLTEAYDRGRVFTRLELN